MKRPKNRKAKALTTANRRAYLGLAIGAATGLALLAMVLSVPPSISSEQLAADVKAQTVRLTPAGSPGKNGQPPPAGLPLAATASPGQAPRSVDPPHERPQYLPVGFDKLSAFPFVVTDQMVDGRKDELTASRKTVAQIPDGIKALNEREISLRGFMLPMKCEGRLTTEFLLLKNQGLCCYGVSPKINEWVNVRVAGKGVKVIMDEPVTVCGTFHVGDVRQNGELVGIYRLDADKLKGPGD
jgi:hypothetical protein